MNNFFTLLIVSFFSITLFGQKDTLSINLDYKAKGYKSKESVAISNSNNGDLVILIEDKKETFLKLIDEDGQIKKELKTDRLGTYLVNFLGYHYFDDGTYAIVFSDTRKMKFSALKFNFENEKVEQVTLNFKLQKEKYVESITQNNTFYLMTAERRSDNVNFYELNSSDSFNKNTVSFEFISSVSSGGYENFPIDVLTARTFGSGSLIKIDPNSPNSIKTTSGINKLYQLNDEIVFSFDQEKGLTKVIRLNLNDFSIETLTFKKPDVGLHNEGITYRESHNSYIKDSIIFQLAVNKKQMKFTARNFYTKETLKEIHLKKDDSITFKNGPIVIEGEMDKAFVQTVNGPIAVKKKSEASTFIEKINSPLVTVDMDRKSEKTSKFLRKLSSAQTGITAVNMGGKLQLTLGGFKEYKGTGAPMMIGGFGPTRTSNFMEPNAVFNPTLFSYDNYNFTAITYINCVFDDQFNHLNDEVKENVFDAINDYEDHFEEIHKVNTEQLVEDEFVDRARMKLKNVFYHNGNHYLGYLNTVDRNYHLVKF